MEEKKRKNPARRERTNPDWPISVYKWDVWPVGEAPQALWDTARLMNRLWNDLTRVFTDARGRDTEGLTKEERTEVYSQLNLEPLRNIARQYKGLLTSACYYSIVDRFLVTYREWRKNPKRNGPPRFKHGLNSINIPIIWSTGKDTREFGRLKQVSAKNTLHLKPDAGEPPSMEYLLNGRFCIGVKQEEMSLHVAMHRELPAGRMKRALLVGRLERPFGWKWSLQVQFESPKSTAADPTGRTAGLDLGWRIFEDRIRLGVLWDGHRAIEIAMPLAIETFNRRRERAFVERIGRVYGKGSNLRDIVELQSRLSLTVEACKSRLKELPKEVRARWPEDVKKIFAGIKKMRERGLSRMLWLLRETDSLETKEILTEWKTLYDAEYRKLRALQLSFERRKDDNYRKIASWLAKNFDVLAWEGKLDLKKMAEEESGNFAIEASKKYRQMVGQYRLREYIKQAFDKHQKLIINCPAPHSTRTCNICGGDIAPSPRLVLTCENGHRQDQDVNAGMNFFDQISEELSSTDQSRPQFPQDLKQWLNVL